ncbi:MAG: hypothetical protein M1817_001525 [Caeruleum heppii]|nr:MAG: hypothetical protein M1817_001525 [Caeruleum heppii]
MAPPHQLPGRRPAVQLSLQNLPTTTNMPSSGDDELGTESDEPPDEHFHSDPLDGKSHDSVPSKAFAKTAPPPYGRKQSLLTQALVLSPTSPASPVPALANDAPTLARGPSATSTWSNPSVASTADLTSDGGLTASTRSNTPSPPLPAIALFDTPHLPLLEKTTDEREDRPMLEAPPTSTESVPQEPTVEAKLGRKRCITFACGRKASPKDNPQKSVEGSSNDTPKPPPLQRRILKFACPFRNETEPAEGLKSKRLASPAPSAKSRPRNTPTQRPHRESESTVRAPSSDGASANASITLDATVTSPKRAERAEATRFHEFASSLDEEDEWLHDPTIHTNRITVGDTLRKENAIRRLGEEAEEEALQDEDEQDIDNAVDQDVDGEEEDDASDDGNETDDEEGFAASDDDSDAGSEYNFWTPRKSTAATSVEHADHIRPHHGRTLSDSSMESVGEFRQSPSRAAVMPRKVPRRIRGRPGTPQLPDSTDFVCGTLDEDRPLEDAYVSCMEERRRSKHTVIPQDIDPSFPTSDPEDDDRDDDEVPTTEEHTWIKGQLDDYEDASDRKSRGSSKRASPQHSPKRLQSPPPTKRGVPLRSPGPGRLFGASPGIRRDAPPALVLGSHTGRRVSMAVSPKTKGGIDFARVSRRPDLIQTKSLPRTPAPFLRQPAAELVEDEDDDNELANGTRGKEPHNRGAIDIVKGLEKKKQRRKEKAWHKYCQQRATNPRERKAAPGKGAERMREVGLEMAGRNRAGHGHGFGRNEAQFVLSI